ncbi:MAG TPA: ABC transporter substrate-binding protein [Chloroflexota bacterium]|nr:ABC transporter substrate-binding protein [Chloroflexota bacterium]
MGYPCFLRRPYALLASLLVSGLVLAACTPAAAPSPTAVPSGAAAQPAAKPAEQPAAKPIRIGVPLDTTGPLSVQGKAQQHGIEVAYRQLGGQVAGRPLELVHIDSESTPEAGLRVTRRLVERDQVDAIVGYINSATGYSTRDFLHQSRMPTITMAASAGLTRENKSPYIWRMIPSTFQWAYEPAKYLRDKLGVKRVIFWGADYAAPREGYRAAKAVFGDGIVKEVWTPLNTIDYAPYLSGIRPGDADMVIVAAWGADGVRIAEQYSAAGLKERLPLFGFASYTSEELLAGFPPDAIRGVQSAYVYCAALDNPANREFVALYRERAGELPGDYAYAAYLSLLMMARAIELVNGDTSDPDRLVQALAQVKLENTPTGTQSFDANQGWVTDFFWRQVDVEGGKPVNRCVDRLPQVADPIREFPTVQ